MPGQDLYIAYLGEMGRDELRSLAKNVGLTGITRMDKPELVVALLDDKIRRSGDFIVTQARLWALGNAQTERSLRIAVEEYESLKIAREEWEKKLPPKA